MSRRSARFIAGSILAGILWPCPAMAEQPASREAVQDGPSPDMSQDGQGGDGEDPFFLEVAPPDDVLARDLLEALVVPRGTLTRDAVLSVIADIGRPDTSKGAIQVCFRDGSVDLQRAVMEHAEAWQLPGTSVKFDFGTPVSPRQCGRASSAPIRISFEGRGTWSLVGLESRLSTGPTMNFDGNTNWLGGAEREFRRAVQHEFGHALGLYHEHQHPGANCAEEIDWPKAYLMYRSLRFNLSDEEIRRNFQSSLRNVSTGDFDEASIMLPELPRQIFREALFRNGGRPSCYFEGRRYKLSDGDQAVIRKYYPDNPAAVRGLRQDAFERYRAVVGVSEASATALALVSAAYPFDGPGEAEPYVAYGRLMLREQRK